MAHRRPVTFQRFEKADIQWLRLVCGMWQNSHHLNTLFLWLMDCLWCEVSQMATKIKKTGRVGGMYLMKWLFSQRNNSWSIHPFSDKPYNVPGTSPLVTSWLSLSPLNITIGGITLSAVLSHTTTVIYVLFPEDCPWTFSFHLAQFVWVA